MWSTSPSSAATRADTADSMTSRIERAALTLQGINADLDRSPLLVERSDGLRLHAGWNVLGTFETSLRPHRNLTVAERVRVEGAASDVRWVTRELMGRFHFGAWTLAAGRGTRALGRGERGHLLLDENAAPIDRVELRSDQPLHLPGRLDSWGEFGVVVLNGVLPFADELPDDPRFRSGDDAVERPNLLGMRFTWAPRPWLEVGMTRTVLYGGRGREAIDTFGEWWKLLTAESENRVDGIDASLDNEQFASMDLEVRIPWLADFGPVESARYYIEYAGTDVYATWQGDDTPGLSPIALTDVGVLQGGHLRIASTDLVVEHVRIHRDWYRHGEFPQGYTNGGISLGHPLGGDAEGWFVGLERSWADRWHGRVALTFDEVGLHQGPPRRERTLLARWERSLSGVGTLPSAVFLDLGLQVVRDARADDRRSMHVGLGVRFGGLADAF